MQLQRFQSLVLLACTGALWLSCVPPDDDDNFGPPPLFNAVDPSLQCPAGQVGWDFSTGGNTDGLRRNSVGGTITITEATFGGSCSADYAAQFRSGCDGFGECTIAVPGCNNGDMSIRYQCGTESPIYKAQLHDEGQVTLVCGSPMTIVNAIYAPGAEEPADITNALAAVCTGKRRCANGESGYALNQYADPWPNRAKTVQVTYVCDADAIEHQVLVDDFKLDFYCEDTSGPSPRPIEFMTIHTVVPRSFERAKIPRAPGTAQWILDRDAQAYANARQNFTAHSDALFERFAASCDLERECELTFEALTYLDDSNFYENIEPQPGEFDPTGAELAPADLRGNYQDYFVGYTCGSDPSINYKRVPRVQPNQERKKLKLQCGETMTVTAAYVDGQGIIRNGIVEYPNAEDQARFLELLKANCDSERICHLPTASNRAFEWFRNEQGQVRNRQYQHGFNQPIRIEYTCGDLDFARRYTVDINYRGQEGLSFECPAASADVLARGIRIDSVSPPSFTNDVTKACFGLDSCNLPRGDFSVTYRCGAGVELLSGRSASTGGPYRLECRPSARFLQRYVIDDAGNRVDIQAGRCEYSVYADDWYAPDSTFIIDSAGSSGCQYSYSTPSCPYNISYDTNDDGANDATIDLCSVEEIHWDFQCGADPSDIQTFTSVAGENWDKTVFPAYPRYIEDISCEPPLTPYVHKKCVPQQCLSKSRRGEELECEPDSTLIATFSRKTPIVKTYAVNPDGTPARWGGEVVEDNGVVELKSGFPYQIFPLVTYQTEGGASQPLPVDTNVTTWAYDVFERKPDADPNLPAPNLMAGFRCIVNSTSIEDAYTTYPGYFRMFAGGNPMTIPDNCFGHEIERPNNDASQSWFDAAKRANLPVSAFKENYTRRESRILTSLDAEGANTVRWFSTGTYAAVNPIGFFYDPVRDWVDILGFYIQTADVGLQKTARFAESSEIEIGAVNHRVTANEFRIDVNDSEFLPQLSVDFSWYLRGDSVQNPYSRNSQDVNAQAYSVSRDNMRAVVEIAYGDGENTGWTAVDAARFAKTPALEGQNAFFQTERINLEVSDLMRTRMLKVRGSNPAYGESADGWMQNFRDEDTLFKVRTCLVSDEFTFPLGGSTAEESAAEVNGFGLRLGRRCTEPTTLVLNRELFETPLPVAQTTSSDVEGASMGGSGDSDVKEDRDTGSQSSCATRCTVNGDCNGGTCGDDGICLQTSEQQRCVTENRSDSGSGVGVEGLTLYANRTDTSTRIENGTTTTTTGNVTELLGFQVMEISRPSSVQLTDASPKYDITVDTGFGLRAIIDAAKNVQTDTASFGVALNGKETRIRGSKRLGIEFLIFVQGRFAIGPFPFTLKFEWATQLTPALTLRFAGGRFRSASDNLANTFPCYEGDDSLGTATKCYVVEDEPKSFREARTSCREKGGRLATVYGADEATELADVVTSSTQPHWMGGISRYLYRYSPCADVGTPGAAAIPASVNCATESLTSHTWLTSNGGQATVDFARQAGTETTFSNVTLPTGMSMRRARSAVTQAEAGIYFQEQPSAGDTAATGAHLGHKPMSEEHPYVCEYDRAAMVGSSAQDVSIALEVMSALRLELCTPSSDAGICLEGRLKFFTAELRFGVLAEQTDIYKPHPVFADVGVPYSTLNGVNLYGDASISFLVADINVILRFVFWDTSILIKKFDPELGFKARLFEVPNNSYQLFSESP